MKTYLSDTSLRIVGKAWQIRAALRTFAGSKITLQSYLDMHGHPTVRKRKWSDSRWRRL
ncbi:Z-ring formation inhibitor MciZ [Effusibacillus pohliae]|uniref:Z-ring formation inhibitor MciZ n=1 Tax=Effusibacillus pohliae TaxID=232270 RepID=UPI0009FEF947|nr:Z-ring formation inhibitor MciZ [Effusibacillus pohliae]